MGFKTLAPSLSQISTMLLIPRLILTTFFVTAIVAAHADEKKSNVSSKKFNIGIIFPLSGGLAYYGKAIRQGFELAQEEMAKEFSHLNLRYEDSQYDEKIALSAFNALEQQGGIHLYHTWGVSPNASILPVANSKRRPVVAETSMRSAAAGRPYVVRFSRTGYGAAQKLIEEFEKRGWHKIGLVATQIPYHMDIVDALNMLSRDRMIELTIVDFVPDTEQDFKSIILKLRQRNFDAIATFLLTDQLTSFCKQAIDAQYSFKMIGTHILNSGQTLRSCLPLSNGALFPGHIVSEEFRNKYMARYHSDLAIDSAADSYETAKSLASLFGNEQSHTWGPEKIVEQFKQIHATNTSIGDYTFYSSPDSGNSIDVKELILTYQNGSVIVP